MNKRTIGGLAGALGLVLFLAVNVFANATLRQFRVDLTKERLFTLSEGSKRIAADVAEPIRLYFFFARDAGRKYPEAGDYAKRVQDVLEEYVRHSDGNLVLEVIDPEPFSEEEDRAVREGLVGIPFGEETLYFGLVGTNATDDRQVIPFFGERTASGLSFQEKERFLEYDLSRLIYSLANPQKKRLAILSTLPIEGGQGNPVMGQGVQPRWKFLDQVGTFFELVFMRPSDEEIPEDIDALLVIHPSELSETLQYALDQYVMAGGKLVAMVDPHCEADNSTVDPTNPMGSMGASRESDLNGLFGSWGFEVVRNKVVGDKTYGLPVQLPGARTPQGVQYVPWMQVGEDSLDREDPVTSLLNAIMLISPGAVRATADATTTFTPLIETSEESMEIDVGQLQFRPDPQGLLERFVPGMTKLALAARVTGETRSAFPDGKPLGAVPGTEGEEDSESPEDAETPHLDASDGPIHVIVIADADMIADRWWIQESTLFGQVSLGWRKTSDNCDLVLNAVENLTGGEDLISIRARGKFSRPFERVEAIRRDAQQRFLSQEQELERRMRELEEELTQLQAERDPNDPSAQYILSPEQARRYEQAMLDREETRKKLRDVRHDMDKDIERLGNQLEGLNIFAIPLLVSVVAIGLGVWRVQRRTR
jgi:ABC-type uncharacterized transport system involved in gliding motility auxiliary subunit